MKYSSFCISLLLSLLCCGIQPVQAKEDGKKMSAAEKREMRKKEREAKKSKKDKGKKDDDKKEKKIDKKAFSKVVKSLKSANGRFKPNSKFFVLAAYTTLSEDSEEFLKALDEKEAELKRAKVSLILLNLDANEEKDAIKEQKKLKIKLPFTTVKFLKQALHQDNDEPEDDAEVDPTFMYPGAPGFVVVTQSGKVVDKGGTSDMSVLLKAVGVDETTSENKEADDAGDDADEESEDDEESKE